MIDSTLYVPFLSTLNFPAQFLSLIYIDGMKKMKYLEVFSEIELIGTSVLIVLMYNIFF